MTQTHRHKCSQGGAVWEHGHDSLEHFREHICQTCGYLELMVDNPGGPPFGPADYPQAVANFLKVLDSPDEAVRAAAAFSLRSLSSDPSTSCRRWRGWPTGTPAPPS